jgi:hypothetical protein
LVGLAEDDKFERVTLFGSWMKTPREAMLGCDQIRLKSARSKHLLGQSIC